MAFREGGHIRNPDRQIAGAVVKSTERSRMHPDDHAAHMQWILVKRLWEQMKNPAQDPNPFYLRLG